MRVLTILQGAMLAGMSILGPMVAYAGIGVIYPSSTFATDVNTAPPITFANGSDYALAETVGFTASGALIDNEAAFTITVKGLSGGRVTIEKLFNLSKISQVSSYKAEIASVYDNTGGLTPTNFTVRLWHGANTPTADQWANDSDTTICAALNLLADPAVESLQSPCNVAQVDMMVSITLPTSSSGTGTVKVRPSSILFA